MPAEGGFLTSPTTTLPPLTADLLLLHAPAVFEFRDRSDIYFPFLGTSGDVPITPLYEYFPVGFKTLQRFLTTRGYSVELLNLSVLLLRYPQLSLRSVVEALDVPLVGIDLHWMIHVQGCLAVAESIKQMRPDVRVILGGTSSTYYADELIRYPFVDMVMRGYDTHSPMAALLASERIGKGYERVPNLLWKTAGGEIRDNGITHNPDTFGCGIDWSVQPQQNIENPLRIREFLSTQHAGCAYNCGWCGGSREAFRRIFKRKRAMARKSIDEVRFEFETMNSLPGVGTYHFYSVGSYNETTKRLDYFLDRVAESNFKSISYEQFHLTPDHVLRRMARANKKTIITLSPESHDPYVAKLAGRGVYSNEELEAWLERAFDFGIFQVDVWYFVGMPEQSSVSVLETVEYCRRLLEKYRAQNVNPIICPMISFLDPASTFFEYPKEHGYQVFFRTVEEHRRGMERASIINRINYETECLSRSDLVHVGFEAVRRLMEAKAEFEFLPRAWVNVYNAKIQDAIEFIDEVHAADCIVDDEARRRELRDLGEEILRRNNMMFTQGVQNQAFPISRDIGGRWFDEMGWSTEVLDQLTINPQGDATTDHPENAFGVSPVVTSRVRHRH